MSDRPTFSRPRARTLPYCTRQAACAARVRSVMSSLSRSSVVNRERCARWSQQRYDGLCRRRDGDWHMRDLQQYWLYTLARHPQVTVHAAGSVCLRVRRKSSRWTGPLTLQQVRQMADHTYFVCDRCLPAEFTGAPRAPGRTTRRAQNSADS